MEGRKLMMHKREREFPEECPLSRKEEMGVRGGLK